MSVQPHLLHVTSGPKMVSEDLYQKWYAEEHIPDIIKARVASRGMLYRESASPADATPNNAQKFLALYQTEYRECMKTANFIGAKKTSEMFPLEGGTKSIQDNADFSPRYYELAEVFDPKEVGNTAAPTIMTVEIESNDLDDVDKWYKEEHFPMLAKAPGYRRGLRYRLGVRNPMQDDETYAKCAKYLTIHEVDDLNVLATNEVKAASETEWTKKVAGACSTFVPRGWTLQHCEE